MHPLLKKILDLLLTSENMLTFEHYVNEIHTLSMSNSRMSISI